MCTHIPFAPITFSLFPKMSFSPCTIALSIFLFANLALCLPLEDNNLGEEPAELTAVQQHQFECGISGVDVPPPDAQSVYRGEDVAQDAHLPWMAFLLGPAICTGTVVHPNWVLSAGHCVNAGSGKAFAAEHFHVYVGSANLSNAQAVPVERILLRSEYGDRIDDMIGSVTTGDMALLKLATPLNFTETLRPICLSREGALTAAGGPLAHEVLVAGWGNTKPHCESTMIWKLTHPKIPERLQFGRERILPTQKCIELETSWHVEQLDRKVANASVSANGAANFPGARGFSAREVQRRIASKMADKICVISDKTVVESGDSGGPLMVSLGGGKWTQLGTLTGGPCHGREAPMHDYYTQIDCDWIAIQTDNEVQCH